MTDKTTQLMQNALREIRNLRAKVDELEKQHHEAIAVVGLGCHFPGGADDPQKFWQLLVDGVDAVVEVPSERWDIDRYYDADPDAPGKMHCRYGGFLQARLDQFDPQFFGMTPREALSLEPQQRLLLETTWQVLENANIAPDSLFKTKTGVYVGMAAGDYAHKVLNAEPRYLDAYYETGNALSVAAGRLSYLLGATGPGMVVDTACSSSLVALHLACQALRNGECDLAIVGGVNALVSPANSIAFSSAHMLSADGRCKTFAASADGYGRGEGCGVVILKRLQTAIDDKDTVLAVIRGSAVNQDGASGGLTVPNGVSQQVVVKQALANAGIEPRQVSYIEAHGTGTRLGDPIEINALAEVFGKQAEARQTPLWVGSVKTNFGHLEAAAGIAGFIKTVLSLQHRHLPKHLHFDQASPHIDWQRMPIRVAAEGGAWPEQNGSRIAGVSSFGFCGTNAHVIVEQYRADEVASEADGAPYLLLLSARTDTALAELTGAYRRFLHTEPRLNDVAIASAIGRNHYHKRRAVVGASSEQLQQALAADSALAGEAVNPASVWLFTGQGAQYAGMGRRLYESQAVFAETLDACDCYCREQLRFSLLDLLYPDEQATDSGAIHRTANTQPALFAIEYALAQLWLSWGIQPDAVAGHSIGEYVAACVAGVFSWQDGLKLASARGRLMQSLPEDGAMAAAFCPAETLQPLLVQNPGVVIAAYNAPGLHVLSGIKEAVAAVAERLQQQGVNCQFLRVSHAFHSMLMEPILAEFEQLAAQVEYRTPTIPLYSNLDGQPLQDIDAAHWRRHLREPVYYRQTVDNLLAQGYRVFLECGPHAVLSGLGRQCSTGSGARWIASLQKGQDDRRQIKQALAELYEAGVDLDWRAVYRNPAKPAVLLPNYPFQRKSYWLDEVVPAMPSPPFASTEATMSNPTLERVSIVKQLLKDISSIAIEDIDEQQNFMAMGLDSLLLVQLQQALERRFGINIPITEFYQSADSVAKIAGYLAEVLPETPPQTSERQAAALAAEPIAAAGACDGSALERLLSRQMQEMSALFEKQLQLLQGQPLAAAGPVAAPPALGAAKPKAAIAGLYKEIQTQKNAHWDAGKQAYIEKLARLFNGQTGQSKHYAGQYKKVLAHNRNVAFRPEWKELVYQIAFDRARGAKTWDIDGNEYIDITMGFGVNLFGHNPEFVKQALLEELQRDGLAIGPISRLTGEVAELMAELTGLERVAFFNTGSEAVMVALRIARGVTGRDKIAVFNGSYHGSFDGVLATGWCDAEGQASSFPLAPGTLQNFVNDVIVLKYGDAESLKIIERLGDTLAAVLVEPVQSRNPSLQPREFLHELRRLTVASGTALIFDEMITGFRLHPGGAQAWYGVQADLATYGKILGGGMAIGAVAGSARFMSAIDGGYWQYGDDSLPTQKIVFVAGTFNMHPLAMAAAKAVLTEIKRQGPALQEGLNLRTKTFCEELNAWFLSRQVPITMVYCGSLFRFQMQGDIELLNIHLLQQGVLIWEGRNCFFSTAHSDDDIAYVAEAVKCCVEAMYADGWLQADANTQRQSSAAPIPPVEKQADYPLSNAQKRLWTLEQLAPGLVAYNLPSAVKLPADLDVEAMAKAVQSLLMRHESLRTYFVEQDGLPRQKIAVVIPDVLEEMTLADESAVLAFAKEEAETPFDLSQPPLIRIKLILVPDGYWMLITLHHIIGDLLSIEILAKDLFALYQAYRDHRDNPLPPLPVHYKDFAQWQDSVDRSEHREYWQNKMAGAEPLNLPLDNERGVLNRYQGEFYRFALTPEQSEQFTAFCRRQGVTVFMGITAALKVALHALSGQHDVVVGSIFAGREHVDLHEQIGFYVNTLPLRSQVSQEMRFVDLLATVKQTVLEASKYQAYPFDALCADLSVPRSLSRNPLFDVVLTMDDRSVIAGLAKEYGFTPVEIDTPGSLFDMLLYVNLANGPLEIALNYNTDLYRPETIAGFAELLTAVLQQGCLQPEQSVAALLRHSGGCFASDDKRPA
ncbi:MAG: aminotransferase class III-fold pyridoxal phosphate-dependent enzyme [Methylomonas sp.]|nr:aminotransferase class III-fold pyridoxal phosphate-dependent enzyme [Methylomonas sp.]